MAQDTHIQQIAVTDIPNEAGGIIRFIELNRPEKLNCLSLEMLKALLAALEHSENCKLVILTGAGRSFCTGLDFKEIGGPEVATLDSARTHLQQLVNIFRWFLTAKIPTIVLARGYAAGGGAGLVACAQTAVVSEDFRCKLPGGNLARLACIAVTVFNLRTSAKLKNGQKCEPDWFGRYIEATEAEQSGLVDRVISLEQLDDFICAIKAGKVHPDLIRKKERNPIEVQKALTELESFLQEINCSRPD